MELWSWVAATCRGTSHVRSGIRLQDAQFCFIPKGKRNDVFVAIVSDGAGSASFGGQGATLICRSLAVQIRHHFRSSTALPSDGEIQSWVDLVRDRIFAVADRRDLIARDFAATLVLAVSDGRETIIAHIGDGSAVLKDDVLDRWVAPSWPDHGEYASTTSFVTDDPAPNLRLNRYQGSISALVLFTDGLERLALDFVAMQPFQKFFDGVCRPLFGDNAAGKNRPLARELRGYLNSEPINARTDDDKTLVIAVKK